MLQLPPQIASSSSGLWEQERGSCEHCRAQKLSCNRKLPCARCIKMGIKCQPRYKKTMVYRPSTRSTSEQAGGGGTDRIGYRSMGSAAAGLEAPPFRSLAMGGPRKVAENFIVSFFKFKPLIDRRTTDELLFLRKWALMTRKLGRDCTWGMLPAAQSVLKVPWASLESKEHMSLDPRIKEGDGSVGSVFLIRSHVEEGGAVPVQVLAMDDGESALIIMSGNYPEGVRIYINSTFTSIFASLEEVAAYLREWRCLPIFALAKFCVDDDILEFTDACTEVNYCTGPSVCRLLKMKDKHSSEFLAIVKFSALVTPDQRIYQAISILPCPESRHITFRILPEIKIEANTPPSVQGLAEA